MLGLQLVTHLDMHDPHNPVTRAIRDESYLALGTPDSS